MRTLSQSSNPEPQEEEPRLSRKWSETLDQFVGSLARGNRRRIERKKSARNSRGMEEVAGIKDELKEKLKIYAQQARSTTAKKKSVLVRIVLLPDGTPRALWDILCVITLGYTFFEIPYALVFLSENCGWEWKDIVNLACDSIFLVDVLLNFNTAFLDENLVIIDDHRHIAVHYVKGWFPIDLASSLPLERVVCDTGSVDNEAYFRFLKGLRLLKMIRVLRFMRVIKKWEMLAGSSFITKVIRLFKFAIFLVFCAHICGCFWMLLIQWECKIPMDSERPELSAVCGCEGPDCMDWNWLERYDPGLASSDHPESKYLASLYFSIVTLSTVGFGDIAPVNDIERAYSIFLALLGAVVFAFCIGSIANLATEGNKTETAIDEKVREVTDFLRFRRLPRPMEARVRKDLFHATTKAPHLFHQCLHHIPGHLKNDIVDLILSEDIAKIPFFRDMDKDCRVRIGSLLRPMALDAHEYLHHALDSSEEMYFVSKGVLEIWNLDGNQIVAKCGPGDIVGHVNMFEDPDVPMRLQSVRARSKAEVLALSKRDFQNVVKLYFPDIFESLWHLALEHLKHMDFEHVAAKMSERSELRCSGFEKQLEALRKTMAQMKKASVLAPTLVRKKSHYKSSTSSGKGSTWDVDSFDPFHRIKKQTSFRSLVASARLGTKTLSGRGSASPMSRNSGPSTPLNSNFLQVPGSSAPIPGSFSNPGTPGHSGPHPILTSDSHRLLPDHLPAHTNHHETLHGLRENFNLRMSEVEGQLDILIKVLERKHLDKTVVSAEVLALYGRADKTSEPALEGSPIGSVGSRSVLPSPSSARIINEGLSSFSVLAEAPPRPFRRPSWTHEENRGSSSTVTEGKEEAYELELSASAPELRIPSSSESSNSKSGVSTPAGDKAPEKSNVGDAAVLKQASAQDPKPAAHQVPEITKEDPKKAGPSAPQPPVLKEPKPKVKPDALAVAVPKDDLIPIEVEGQKGRMSALPPSASPKLTGAGLKPLPALVPLKKRPILESKAKSKATYSKGKAMDSSSRERSSFF